ncbi:hypothetical protein [Jidongwangia harbinensis]|uniref:hypothetical protein n=1 Tax=Jidongwangia harbinensis TaxID=2878561 RepID=UPI001CDA4E04|nr:hypothetical protein [Jidongwangia harbinensis]MCA2217927.1 hypothetical protein [Jidongwangia harbinensis]
MWDELGLTETEERVYRAVLANGSGTVADLAGRLGGEVEPALVALQEKGLVQRDGDGARAAPPDLAIDSLLLSRMHRLQEARIELRDWATRQQATGAVDQGVHMAVGAAAITQTFDQFLRAAREEVLGFDRPPYTTAKYENPAELELLGRGVRFRVVYDRRALERPDASAVIGRFVAAGEEARAALDVPGKLAVADRRAALLYFPGRNADAEPWALVVRGPAWVEVLVALFTEVWERASPLRLAPATDTLADLDRWTMPTATDRRMLSLLMTGLPDKAVASQLGMSLRTVQRRLRQLMDITGSATRMQLGWFVARNDWL